MQANLYLSLTRYVCDSLLVNNPDTKMEIFEKQLSVYGRVFCPMMQINHTFFAIIALSILSTFISHWFQVRPIYILNMNRGIYNLEKETKTYREKGVVSNESISIISNSYFQSVIHVVRQHC